MTGVCCADKFQKKAIRRKLLELIRKINCALQEYQGGSRLDELLFKVDTVLLPISNSSQYEFGLCRFPEESDPAIEYDC